MKMAWRSVRGWVPAALAGFALAGGTPWSVLELTAGDVIVRTYETPEGRTIGSASLPLELDVGVRQNVRHVVLLDTSASQIGEHRQMAVKVLDNFLSSLPETDEVAVLAYDVQTVTLTDWTSPRTASAQVKTALQDRFPAGAANLGKALESARDLLPKGTEGSVLIIGDGMSTAHLFEPAELQSLTASFRERQVPIHSFAVGSKTDLRLLGILGEETGGFVARDEWSQGSLTAEEMGKMLARASQLEVFYPTRIEVSSGVELSPNRPLPMRTDRETVYLLNGAVQKGMEISLTGNLNGQSQNVKYDLPEITRNKGNTFLGSIWTDAKATDGLAIGLAGDWMVNFAHQNFEDQIQLLSAEGQKALRDGEKQQAEQIGTMLQKFDPQNPRGEALIQEARSERPMLAQLPEAGGFDGPNPDDSIPAVPAPGTAVPEHLIPREAPVASDNIINYEALREAKGQKLQREVEVLIDRAYNLVENSLGAQAEETLNRARATIKSASDVPPDLAQNLLRRVNSILQDVRSRRAMFDARQLELQRRQAELEVTTRLIDYAAERDLALEQMVDRIRALMVDAYRGNPEAFESAEAQARVVLSDFPGSAIGNAEVVMTEAAGQVDKAARLRALRADKLLETLYQVELSHVPFPDEPPIVYPPAEVWWAMTKQRQKWKSVDLRTNSPNEEKIYAELDKQTSVEFPGTRLQDALTFISQQHGIPIRLDMRALDEESLTGEEEIQLVMSGIKLRNALKLMLENVGGVQLTYVVEDEVMKITTQTAADDLDLYGQTRVYPVGDLVVPPNALGGMGGMMGGMGGGMMGGMGGGMGGMGGGMGGMGGMGGGMMGGGGNFFSIPATPPAVNALDSELQKLPAADVDAPKKKPLS